MIEANIHKPIGAEGPARISYLQFTWLQAGSQANCVGSSECRIQPQGTQDFVYN